MPRLIQIAELDFSAMFAGVTVHQHSRGEYRLRLYLSDSLIIGQVDVIKYWKVKAPHSDLTT